MNGYSSFVKLEVAAHPPSDWPWALPHYHSVETIADPGVDVVGYSARKDGTGSAKMDNVRERTRVVLIGYWDRRYAMISSRLFLKRQDAERCADVMFKRQPIRFRCRDGAIAETNESIIVTGQWPIAWTFHRLFDLGAFCAFLYSQLLAVGRAPEAERFKKSLHYAMPGTEAIEMFRTALTTGKEAFGQWLTSAAQSALDDAINQCDIRLK